MKRICKRDLQIDAFSLCFELTNNYHFDHIKQLDYGEVYDLYEFYLTRIEGKYYHNVYTIKYDYEGKANEIGQLKFNNKDGKKSSNIHENGNPKVWIALSNHSLYTDEKGYIGFIAEKLGLTFHNFTTLDLCLDTPFCVSKLLRRYIRDKSLKVKLNGKYVQDRDEDRPEITFTMSGSLNKDKYLTVTVKQRNAIMDKRKGITVTTYDKRAEILNASGKDYILEYYGNPDKLYRTEVHLNNDEIKDFLKKEDLDLNPYMLDAQVLEALFFDSLNSVIHFKKGREEIKWEDLLGRR